MVILTIKYIFIFLVLIFIADHFLISIRHGYAQEVIVGTSKSRSRLHKFLDIIAVLVVLASAIILAFGTKWYWLLICLVTYTVAIVFLRKSFKQAFIWWRDGQLNQTKKKGPKLETV